MVQYMASHGLRASSSAHTPVTPEKVHLLHHSLATNNKHSQGSRLFRLNGSAAQNRSVNIDSSFGCRLRCIVVRKTLHALASIVSFVRSASARSNTSHSYSVSSTPTRTSVMTKVIAGGDAIVAL